MRKGFTLIELMIVVAIIAIIAAIAIPSLLRSRMAANEASAASGLKQITSHQASFSQTDGDGNGLKDYWTIDIAGFYGLEDAAGTKLKYIDVSFAKADDNAVQTATLYPNFTPSAVGSGIPKSGYLYRAIAVDEDGTNYFLDPDGDTNFFTNNTKYGFVTYPEVYGNNGVNIFIVNEAGVVYRVDNGEHATLAPKGNFAELDALGANAWPDEDPTSTTAKGSGRTWGTLD